MNCRAQADSLVPGAQANSSLMRAAAWTAMASAVSAMLGTSANRISLAATKVLNSSLRDDTGKRAPTSTGNGNSAATLLRNWRSLSRGEPTATPEGPRGQPEGGSAAGPAPPAPVAPG